MFDCQQSVDHVFECVSVSAQSLCSSGVLCDADVVCVSVSAQSLCSSGVLCEADVVFQSQHRVCVPRVFCVKLMLCFSLSTESVFLRCSV